MIDPPRTLLVLKPGSFGDILHTLPAVARLKAAWPECRISWLANTEWMPLLAGNPAVDEVIEFPRSEIRGLGGGWKAVRWAQAAIAGRRPDLALDFQGLLRSALIGRASGSRMLLGLSDAREGARWLYDRAINPPPQPVHAVLRYLALADAALGREPSGVNTHMPFAEAALFHLPTGEAPASLAGLRDDFILVHPYARGRDKSLDPSQIAMLVREIGERQVVLVGRGDAAVGGCGGHCVNLINQTSLPELIWLARHAAFVASVDSGPAHLAAALGKPIVAIHSWSDPRKVGPYHPDAWVWKNGTLAQMRDLASMEPRFFNSEPLHMQPSDLSAIARLALAS